MITNFGSKIGDIDFTVRKQHDSNKIVNRDSLATGIKNDLYDKFNFLESEVHIRREINLMPMTCFGLYAELLYEDFDFDILDDVHKIIPEICVTGDLVGNYIGNVGINLQNYQLRYFTN